MDEIRISSREIQTVSCLAFLAAGAVTRLHRTAKFVIEHAALLKVLTRDAEIECKLDRPDEFDLEALGLAEAVSRFTRSKGVQGCADQRRWRRTFDRSQGLGRAQNAGHHYCCDGETSRRHGPLFCLQRQF